MVYISRIQTPYGEWEICASERGIMGVSAQCSDRPLQENIVSRQAARELQAYFCGAANDIHCTVGLGRNTLPTCGMAELASDPIREFPVLWTGGGAARKAKGSTCGWTGHWAKSLSYTGAMSSGSGKRPAADRVFCGAGTEKGTACVGEHQFLLTDTSLRGIRFLCFRISGC